MKGCIAMSPLIHHPRRSTATQGRPAWEGWGWRRRGTTPLGRGLHPLIRPGGAEEWRMRQQQDPLVGIGELAAPSITQIIRSEKRRGRGGGGVYDGTDGWTCPWEWRRCRMREGEPGRSELDFWSWTVLKQSVRTAWRTFQLLTPTEMFDPFLRLGRPRSDFPLYQIPPLSKSSWQQLLCKAGIFFSVCKVCRAEESNMGDLKLHFSLCRWKNAVFPVRQGGEADLPPYASTEGTELKAEPPRLQLANRVKLAHGQREAGD